MRRSITPKVILIALVCVGSPAPAFAQSPPAGPSPEFVAEKARALDTLFTALGRTALQPDADRIVEQILTVWARSGRSDIDLLLVKADAAIQTRSYGLAALLLDEVVDDAPFFAEGWNRRATLRVVMGDTAGALADIEKTLSLEPRHFGALAGRGMIHVGAGRWADALAAYRAALAVNPFLPERHQVIPELERKVERGRL